ncbi:acyl-CoA--6-aminopenicillanic acid acyl-transferase [Sphingobacterium sp. DK4209]|uniref:Acyl-CoA--6-aminopenicillanic acid acyl-transferase n=1 Tax=Sphingobacterium zhuxiongii TaxID=2662364 RepID=A0A5Q0Q759_9SPHI|nr:MULTISPECIES: C45 family peptidase [unclassified Sphingobacterium]MVZ64580.1 acyl-CoA--6-aminopenicillanic acid acyl-transferase [Sphingobacterium sp. DK4209]QGA25907.1 acyl-CoA--6-aminopenicillanic acid acyl-transferase [Sphingobacterium sp. dk4302]
MTRFLFLFCVFLLFSSCGSIKGLKNETSRFNEQFDSSSVIFDKHDQLNRSPYGNWQLRIEGNDFELGYKKGKITQTLFQNQEDVFFKKMAEYIPNPKRQRFLVKFLKWYHKDILTEIPLSYRQEIFGLSLNANEKWKHIGTKYERSLLLHGAHDIGHAMQDLMLVGCSSVALWDQHTSDGQLLIARNFDFYINEDFAENKIIEFIKPSEGYNFAAVSWPGMVGVVSGMNEKGLTISLNAGKSHIPLSGKTPISIVARTILQHAKNIDEAINIAKEFKVFVAESLLIGSSEDNKAVNIEISPKRFDVYTVENDILFCTNHFQSATYSKDKRNQAHISSSHSQYRLDKLKESIKSNRTYEPKDLAPILRDVTGMSNRNIGYGNEKALNQLIAHHAVIFKPDELIMWVSNNPYQLGTFEAYNLAEIFKSDQPIQAVKSLEIPADPFLETDTFANFLIFRRQLPLLEKAIKQKKSLSAEVLTQFEDSNPNFWLTHKEIADYYYSQNNWEKAAQYYENVLTKEISSEKAKEYIQKRLIKAKKKS